MTRGSNPRSTFCGVLIALSVLFAPPLRAVDRPGDSGRTVAIGDVHGDFDSFVSILQRTGLVDDRLKWTGGTATLVQTGDLMDRGPKVRPVLDLLMALEDQAAQSGGRLIVLLGNHEVMNLMRDVRDVAPAAYAAFATDSSAARQQRGYREYVAFMAERKTALGGTLPVLTQEAWLQSHPPGFLEYADAFDTDGVYGRWLRSRKVVITIGDTAFLHAGIDPSVAPSSLDAINRRVRDEIRRFDEYRRYLIDRRIILPSFTLSEIIDGVVAEVKARNAVDERDRQVLSEMLRIGTWDSIRPDGPLWFRGFATWSPTEGASLIRKLQEKYNVAHWIVGHTISSSLHITPRFGSQVFLIDTGMTTSHFPGERSSALEIRDGRFTAIAGNEQTVLLAPQTASPAAHARQP